MQIWFSDGFVYKCGFSITQQELYRVKMVTPLELYALGYIV